MHVFAGGVGTETNTFSPIPTGLADFDVARPSQDISCSPSSSFSDRQPSCVCPEVCPGNWSARLHARSVTSVRP